MRWRTNAGIVALLALALAAGLRCGNGGPAADAGTCSRDQDCPGGRCVDGRCVPDGGDADADLDGDTGADAGADADPGTDGPGPDGDGDPGDPGTDVPPPEDGAGDEGVSLHDGDGDTIPDDVEGWDDVDGDGLPNAEDTDSDGDGIDDATEAVDDDLTTPPPDSDRDGTPDFLDPDSDGDTIRDEDEWLVDDDGDGMPAYRDFDSDGDGIGDDVEAGDADPATAPVDSDDDGVPDFRDRDSDGDLIADADETAADTDGDTVPDYLDLDSDADTLPDIDEAGDAFVDTPPANCDDDTLENFRDTDSDNDGLRDDDEVLRHGTDPCLPDTDGDGVTDLVEAAYESDPLDPGDSPRTRGDFVFIVEYSAPPDPPIPPDPVRDTLSFSTALQKADVYIAVDSSGSMTGEIDNLTHGLATTIVPGVRGRIADSNFGAGRFEDCPDSGCDNAMNNLQDVTSDVPAVQRALESITDNCGGSEPYIDMLWLLATGDTSGFRSADVRPRPRRCTDATTVGWPCFREDAVKVIIQCGDENIQSCRGWSIATATDAMNAEHIKYIGVWSASTAGSGYTGMRTIATNTGSVDATTGQPLVFRISTDGSGLSDTIVNAVEQLAHNVPIRVDAVPHDDPADAVDAVAEFVDYLETNTSGAVVMGRECTRDLATADGNGDGHPDYFPTVFPGTSVCWDIVPQPNVTVPATEDAQIFKATIDVIGDEYTPLDSRDVYFLVPPVIPGSQ
jgi:hypothetical protein